MLPVPCHLNTRDTHFFSRKNEKYFRGKSYRFCDYSSPLIILSVWRPDIFITRPNFSPRIHPYKGIFSRSHIPECVTKIYTLVDIRMIILCRSLCAINIHRCTPECISTCSANLATEVAKNQ